MENSQYITNLRQYEVPKDSGLVSYFVAETMPGHNTVVVDPEDYEQMIVRTNGEYIYCRRQDE